jgi:hypothetical protein
MAAQVASTRVCAMTGIIGVPVGMQTDWLTRVTTGAPPAITRDATITNCPVVQGGVGVPVSRQPAIA